MYIIVTEGGREEARVQRRKVPHEGARPGEHQRAGRAEDRHHRVTCFVSINIYSLFI